MSKTLAGRCLCGAFSFQVTGSLGEVRLCHCDICRRANGGAYSVNCRVSRELFIAPQDMSGITEYQSSPGAWKAFCATCGSSVYSRVDWDPDGIRLRLGTFDRDVEVDVTAHVWVGLKAIWDQITDDLPCYEKGADSPLIERER